MKLKLYLIIGINFLLLFGCAQQKEFIMPFRNFEYTSNRGFPVKSSNSDFTFKASLNLSTSVDRIITLSMDSTLGNEATLLEVFSSKKGKVKIQQSKLYPKSGFDGFKNKVDSLNLFNENDQEEKDFELVLHKPFSLYVIEIKENEKYNQFKFNTYFPDTIQTSDKYEKLQNLIFKEFHFQLHTK